MKSLANHSNVLRGNLLFIMGVTLCLYFSYHLLWGGRSYAALASLEIEQMRQEMVYSDLVEDRVALEDRVLLMRPGSVSIDVLDENARFVLGYQSHDELSVLDY